MPDPEVFAEFLRSLGVDDDAQIVAYDEGADMYAARFWLVCRWIGHEATAILDGGMNAWRKLGYPTEPGERYSVIPSERTAKAAGDVEGRRSVGLTIRLRPQLIVSASEVQANLNSASMHLLDARAAERFRGDIEPLDPVAGHIPGAQNYWFKNNFDEDGRLRSPQELRTAFERYGKPETIVHQCGSGVSSAVSLLAMEHAGLHGSRIYAGSWSEWCSDPSRPVATGD